MSHMTDSREFPRNRTPSRTRLIGWVACVLLALVVIASAPFLRQGSTSPNPKQEKAPDHGLEESRARAGRTRKAHDKHREEFCRLVVEKARGDESYRKLLLARTKDGVMQLTGMSDEEKEVMWERIKDAQQAVIDAGLAGD